MLGRHLALWILPTAVLAYSPHLVVQDNTLFNPSKVVKVPVC